jgi:hypothetical protein
MLRARRRDARGRCDLVRRAGGERRASSRSRDKDGTALRASFSVRDERGREMAQMMDASGVEGLMLGGFSSTEILRSARSPPASTRWGADELRWPDRLADGQAPRNRRSASVKLALE